MTRQYQPLANGEVVNLKVANGRINIMSNKVMGVLLPDGVCFCRAVDIPAPAPLNAPDGPGWFAYEEKSWKAVIEVVDVDGELRWIDRLGDDRSLVGMTGKWTRIYLPWEVQKETTGGNAT